MTTSYLDHPSEEELERFLLQHAQGDELERVETHIMACDGCVARLEQLEVQMTAVKLALSELEHQAANEPARDRVPFATRLQLAFSDWLSVRNLSWAGAVAALALMVSLTPKFLSKPDATENVVLSATRGTGVTTVLHGRSLHLRLAAQSLRNGPVEVALVDGNGAELWKGSTQVRDDQAEISTPKVTSPGSYYVRLYAPAVGNVPGELLREYPLNVN